MRSAFVVRARFAETTTVQGYHAHIHQNGRQTGRADRVFRRGFSCSRSVRPDRIAVDLLANNFGMPEKSIANFNRKRMVISAAATPT
jgi:hypothetical protein